MRKKEFKNYRGCHSATYVTRVGNVLEHDQHVSRGQAGEYRVGRRLHLLPRQYDYVQDVHDGSCTVRNENASFITSWRKSTVLQKKILSSHQQLVLFITEGYVLPFITHFYFLVVYSHLRYL
jgi:hypothetical protein